MRDLNLTRLIPLATVGALSVIGCGGRSTTNGGDGDDDGGGDYFTEAGFERSVKSGFVELCEHQLSCEAEYFSEYYDSAEECAEYLSSSIELYYELEKIECRKLLLETLDCVIENAECTEYTEYTEYTDACSSIVESLYDECYSYDYSDYYDYDEGFEGPPESP